MVVTRLAFMSYSAPGIFYRFTQSVKCMMIRVVIYLYDFLIIGNSKDECQTAYDCLASLLLDLGSQLSQIKLVPSYTLYYLFRRRDQFLVHESFLAS